MKNLKQLLRKKKSIKNERKNLRNINMKLEEKTENMRLNSTNSRT